MLRPATVRPAIRALPALALLALLAAAAPAQTWVPLESPSAPGTPAEVKLVPAESGPELTTVEIKLHGFWKQDVAGEGGVTYQRLTFPGLAGIDQVGAPELPAARFALAVPSKTTAVSLGTVQVLKQATFGALKIYPAPAPGMDEDPTEDPGPGDTQGYEEKFALDPALYALATPWPGQLSEPSFAVGPLLGPVPGASVAVTPVTWNPATSELLVKTWLKLRFSHPAGGSGPLKLNKPKVQSAAAAFLNWPALGAHFQADTVDYKARLLIVSPVAYWPELEGFIALKQAMGFETELRKGASKVDGTRSIIADWYHEGSPEVDHYCLLVGDAWSVPLPMVDVGDESVQSDDLYGAIGHDTIAKDIHVGRLSVDGPEDLARQLKKIMEYQTAPVPDGHYEKALLVAHKEGWPGKYVGAHEAVRNAGYSNPPTFLTRYGPFEASDGPTAADINAGVGLVAYRGHGSTNAMTEWNLGGTWFNKADVLALTNTVLPVFWSFACTNGNIAFDDASQADCLAETWLEAEGAGAVAAYAATRTTATKVNHLHDWLAFQVVYNYGITTHGQALDMAEMLLSVFHPGHYNPWAYLLLGDPTMTVRTEQAKGMVTNLPPSAPLGALAGQGLKVQVNFDNGLPAGGALLSAHKAAFLAGQPDELLAAKWLAGDGSVVLQLPDSLTPGDINVVARTADGSVKLHTIEVGMDPAWTDLGSALAPVGGKAPGLVGLGSLQGGSSMALLVAGAAPARPAWLMLGLAVEPLPFKGGMLIPCIVPPSLVLPLSTDALGNIALDAKWPDGVPSGVSIYTQVWVQDEAGPKGFTASNALEGRTP